jgi:uncharacterized membrane protein
MSESRTSRAHLHIPGNIGDKIADTVTEFFGTWLCLGLHTLWFVLWFVLGLDVALLTNVVSLEAIGLAILIMMSQRRQTSRDRKRDDLEAEEVELLTEVNHQELEILQRLDT